MYCKIYRNIYIKKYNRFPYQKLSGRNDLYYTGNIYCGINDVPDEYDSKKDLYINCDCEFPKWRKLIKIKHKSL